MANIAVAFKKKVSKKEIVDFMRKHDLNYRFIIEKLNIVQIINPRGNTNYWLDILHKSELVRMAEVERQLKPH